MKSKPNQFLLKISAVSLSVGKENALGKALDMSFQFGEDRRNLVFFHFKRMRGNFSFCSRGSIEPEFYPVLPGPACEDSEGFVKSYERSRKSHAPSPTI